MIDLRYHVYSLSAVFVALAIGFVFGTSSVSERADVAKVQRISANYERSFTKMNSDIQNQQDSLHAARAELSRNEKLCAALIPQALRGKLQYRNVAIIQTGDYDDLTAEVKTAIQSAGGYVTNVTKIPAAFDFEDSVAVSDIINSASLTVRPDESGRVTLLRSIAEVVTSAKHRDKLTILEDKHLVSVSGDYDRWARFVVIVGGSASESDRASQVDVPLIERLEGLGAVVIGCEPSGAAASYIPVWKRTDISTVDNADTSCGQVSLICALAGESAHFGQKRTAEKLIPDSIGSGM